MNPIKQAQHAAAHKVVTSALAKANGHTQDAARLLGISPQLLGHYIKKLNLNPADWRIR